MDNSLEQDDVISTDTTSSQDAAIDPQKAMELFEQLKRQQNLPLGIAAGLVAAIVGGAVWAGITVASQMQIGWMAVGVGFLVGLAVRRLGKGLTKPFGIAGGALALLGCLLGNFLAMCGLLAQADEVPFSKVVFSRS